jgi:ergothioneine biosynthesis protein EgtB
LEQRPPSEPASLRWFEYGGGLHWVGHQGDRFSFDNERPRHQVFLPSFQLASRLVTNAEYLAFMNDNGYGRPELWLSEGWDSVNTQAWRAPFYWEQRDKGWVVYTLDGERLVDPAEPVCHVSYFEADAYARWAGARLATEFEWEVAAGQSGIEISWSGDDSPANLLQTKRFHPAASHFADSDSRPTQLFGDVWEWTASQYLPYPGFRPAAGAVGEYNGKFMCNQFVLRGGSCATPANHIRATYRNFFPPHARWQFSGIRLAK